MNITALTDYFSNKDYLNFALLFGSQAKGKTNLMSEVDIAIHANRKLSLAEEAVIENDLQKLLNLNRMEILKAQIDDFREFIKHIEKEPE
ncbi:MAG: nucleotidyltransferase domain-containing protein [Leptospiraceae bacterium]|nr:nucleotidyltransferase domain-containing protein [Leptospiraceae bacterium]